MGFDCETCAKTFSSKRNLNRHTREKHDPETQKFECVECDAVFPRRENFARHITLVHAKKARIEADTRNASDGVGETSESSSTGSCTNHEPETKKTVFKCDVCKKIFTRKDSLIVHLRTRCPGPSQPGPSHNNATVGPSATAGDQPAGDFGEFEQTETAFKSRARTFVLRRNLSRRFTLPLFLTFVFEYVVNLLGKMLLEYSAILVNCVLECEFENVKGETCIKNFKTMNKPLFQASDLAQFCSDMFDKLIHEKEECVMRGSGWSFVKVKRFEIRINKYNPLKGGGYIKLPKIFPSVINTRNLDDFCFKYSILAMFVNGDATKPSRFGPELDEKYNWENVLFPMPLKDIHKFERQNNISINVFGLDKDNKIFPLKVCDQELPDHRDLLFITNNLGRGHYMYISNFNEMIHLQLTKDHGKIVTCKKCFHHFKVKPNKAGLTGEQRIAEHRRYCLSREPLRLDPSPDEKIFFKNTERSQRVRFSLYADFESILKPTFSDDNVSTNTHEHIPHSYCYLVKDCLNDTHVIRTYRGPDAGKHFVDAITKEALKIGDILYSNRKMYPTLTPEEQANFDSATECHICRKEFTESDVKVRDHYHAHPYSFRGAAHSSCNLRHQEQTTINVYFHNLAYDSHFLINELGVDKSNISVIPNSEEKYISFTKYIPYKHAKKGNIKLRFVDTLRFLPSSLSVLANNLPKDCFRETKKRFPNSEQFELSTRKGVFPYEYVTSMDKLSDTQLPPKTHFFSKLTLEDIKDEDYTHAQNVWHTFGIKNLGEYSDLYLLIDVLLIADIFENFRDTSLKTHKLDPAYYITLPSYAFDCMLQKTDIKLETIQDPEIYLFFENAIRGGISQCNKRISKANNKHVKGYDCTKPTSFIHYIDANNLYGWAMSQYLPSGNFQWSSKEEIEWLQTNIGTLSDEADVGYVLEVDIEYPAHLHSLHFDFPFLCERGVPPGGKHPKLLTTLMNKKNYTVHYRLLRQALRHGLKLTKIHRAIRFDQAPWLKPYIDLNTDLRKRAKNDFEKDLFKLFNNSVFGKFMESLRKRLNFKLTNTDRRLEKLTSLSNFLYRTIFSENLVGVHLAKTSIPMDKPIYVGMAILDLSKELMYNFHYDVTIPHYGRDSVELLYTDTDSFILELKTDDLHASMLPILDHFDTSGYNKSNPAYCPDNAKVLGKMKDEVNGVYISKFLGIRSKLYCLCLEDEKDTCIKRCKGIRKPVVEKQLRAEEFERCILEDQEWYTVNTTFRSFKHKVATRSENKLTLQSNDDKRHLLPDRINTLAHGDHRIKDL